MLPEAERAQVIEGFNDTAVDYPTDVCLHELFAAQVARTPDKTAVAFRDQLLTYAELDRAAEGLARKLRELGVGPNVLVGVAMERSLEMVIALYGILKAGGAYVPIDPTYPAERVVFMVEDAAVGVLLTQAHLTEQMPEMGAVVLCVGSREKRVESREGVYEWDVVGEGVERVESGVTADDLAYMIYTSGSTGRPKGAMNGHRGIVNRLLWMQDEYGLGADDRVLQKTPFSFDVSVWEFFWPLIVGAELVVAEPEGHKDGRYLIKTIEQERITTMHFVPSMLNLFLQEKEVERCTSLRRVICSGEALAYELQERFFDRLSAKLHNLYGPTEAAIDVTYWECVPDRRRVVPIGRPVANTQMYIVDEFDQPVGIGVPGELLIGGVQVGKGYWHRPELTKERFVEGKREKGKGNNGSYGSMVETQIEESKIENRKSKIYRTGDLARWRADGVIEYLGRIDFQVKVRGFRIELGEIEAALVAQDGVEQSVVIARPDQGGGHLVAYLVADEGVTVDELRRGLRVGLPEYMVPSHFVMLAEIPLSPNGKVNRKGLPEPDVARPTALFVRPEAGLEADIAQIWCDVLGVERVGRMDNFFDLGGHSLLLAQVRTRLEELVKKELAMVVLFQHPTVASLVEFLDKGEEKRVERVVEKKARASGRREKLAGMRNRRRR